MLFDAGFAAGSDNAPELAARPKFLSTAGLVIEQASKLGLNGSKSMISLYEHHQVIYSQHTCDVRKVSLLFFKIFVFIVD